MTGSEERFRPSWRVSLRGLPSWKRCNVRRTYRLYREQGYARAEARAFIRAGWV